MQKTNLVDFNSPAFGGPYGIHALAVPAIAAAPFEGCWVPLFGAKSATLQLTGSMDTLGVDVYGSNALEDPGNAYTVTIAGTVTTDDVTTLVISNPNLPAGSVSVSRTSVGGDTTTTIAAALAASINASAALSALGITAGNVAGVITLSYPSFAAQSGNSNPSQPAIANMTTVTGSSNGAASETVAVAVTTTGTKLGSTLAAFGLTALTVVPRWVKARLTTLTGTGANVTGRFSAAT